LREATISRWNAPILMADPDWDSVSRRHWQAGEDCPSTLDAAQAMAASTNLVAVLCGHIHFPHVDAVNPRAVQYVGFPGYTGQYRTIVFQPPAS